MRILRIFSVLLVCVTFLNPAISSQQVPPVDQSNTQAVGILQSSFNAMGGMRLATIADTQAAYNATGLSGSGSAIFKTLGTKMWRVEMKNADGLSVFVVNGTNSQSTAGSDQRTLPTIVVAEAGNWLNPVLSIIADWNDPTVKVSSLDPEGSSYHVQIQRTSNDPFLATISGPCDVYIDTSTLLPTRLRYCLHPPSDLNACLPVDVEYSNWTAVSGIVIPYHVKYSFRGNLIADYVLQNFATNTGLTPSDFAITSAS